MKEPEYRSGRCHCGAVQFQVKLLDGLNTARRCNCSICEARGSVLLSAMLKDLDVTAGQDLLSCYQFNTKTAKHYFCSVCGIHTFHQRRSNPEHYGINVACLEGLSPFDFEQVPVYDGKNHHSRDIPAGTPQKQLGVLYFKRDEA